MRRKPASLMLMATLGLALVASAQTFTPGNVFVAIGNGQVQERTPTGTLVRTLDDLSASVFTAGMAFDTLGNLYVTNFDKSTISKFDINGNLINTNFVASNQVSPESISMPGGQFPMLVGDADQIDGGGMGVINQYDASGTLLNSYHVQREDRGTDWVDLQPDLQTVYYTSEGASILSYNIATQTQNSPFATGLPGDAAYAHRTLASGAFAGDTLVADSEFALLVAPGGLIVKTYSLPGNQGADFALNLDPTGTAFWTADLFSGEVWEVDIATGTILQEWNSGFPNTTAGLAVFGEQGQGGGNKCPLSQGYWKNHPANWKLSMLQLGTSYTVTAAQALAILQTPVRGDASLILADQLIAASLNIANGSDPTPVATTITDARTLIGAGPLPENISPSSGTGQSMTKDASILDSYNNDVLTPKCTK